MLPRICPLFSCKLSQSSMVASHICMTRCTTRASVPHASTLMMTWPSCGTASHGASDNVGEVDEAPRLPRRHHTARRAACASWTRRYEDTESDTHGKGIQRSSGETRHRRNIGSPCRLRYPCPCPRHRHPRSFPHAPTLAARVHELTTRHSANTRARTRKAEYVTHQSG